MKFSSSFLFVVLVFEFCLFGGGGQKWGQFGSDVTFSIFCRISSFVRESIAVWKFFVTSLSNCPHCLFTSLKFSSTIFLFSSILCFVFAWKLFFVFFLLITSKYLTLKIFSGCCESFSSKFPRSFPVWGQTFRLVCPPASRARLIARLRGRKIFGQKEIFYFEKFEQF